MVLNTFSQYFEVEALWDEFSRRQQKQFDIVDTIYFLTQTNKIPKNLNKHRYWVAVVIYLPSQMFF